MSKGFTVNSLAKRIFKDRMSAHPVFKRPDEVAEGDRLMDMWTPFDKPLGKLTLGQVKAMGEAWMLVAKMLQGADHENVANFYAQLATGSTEPKRLN